MSFTQKLRKPLQITALTTGGQLLGHFTSREVALQGLFVEGEVQGLLDFLRLSNARICVLEIQEDRKRPIRATVRLDLAFSPRQRVRTKIFFRFVRMGSENQRRYYQLLYGGF